MSMNQLRQIVSDALRRLGEAARPKSAPLVHPHELKPGMRLLVECEVFADTDASRLSHVYIRPTRGSLWQASDQYLWTWSDVQKSHPEPWIQTVAD